MDAIEFIKNYNQFISEIEQVIKPELKIHLDKLRATDPHDLVRPDTFFMNSGQARGFVWELFLKGVKEN